MASTEGEVAVSAPSTGITEVAKALIESATPCHDTQVVGSYQVSSHVIVLASKSEDYTTAPQHLHLACKHPLFVKFCRISLGPFSAS